jgi:hypothetical protein
MTRIKLKDLDLDKMERWVKSARDIRGHDDVFSFICAWIAFNYYYGIVTTENNKRIRRKFGIGEDEFIPDWLQIQYLLNDTVFPKIVSEFQMQNEKELAIIIELPITNVSSPTKKDHPPSRTTDTPLIDLTPAELIDAIYAIRNNLFHGGKDPRWVPRDMRLCEQANTFLVPFVEYLWNNATEALAD